MKPHRARMAPGLRKRRGTPRVHQNLDYNGSRHGCGQRAVLCSQVEEVDARAERKRWTLNARCRQQSVSRQFDGVFAFVAVLLAKLVEQTALARFDASGVAPAPALELFGSVQCFFISLPSCWCLFPGRQRVDCVPIPALPSVSFSWRQLGPSFGGIIDFPSGPASCYHRFV